MAIRDLGETIDIHGGGADLIFPHHESEIAQSEAWTGTQPFSRSWVHVGMVRMDGEKMSKSLGNMVFVEQLLRRHSPAAIRLYLAGFPYRDGFEYDEAAVRASEALAEQIRRAASAGRAEDGAELDGARHRGRFFAALDDDLDTPTAVHVLRTLSGAILHADERGQAIGKATSDLRTMAGILGVVP
jgi:L-cysteine:1D-myo-inositol 2-amino-2-deoxy-alpha-D-glucopyranoside ligase